MPVINLSNVVKLSEQFGLPTVVGADAPEVGQGALYFKGRYDISTTALLTGFLVLVVFVVIRLDLKHYLGRRPRPADGNFDSPEEAI